MAIRLTFRVTPPINRVSLFRHFVFKFFVMLSGWPFFFIISHLGGVAVTCRQAKLCWRVNRGKVAVGFFFSFPSNSKLFLKKKKKTLQGIRHPTVFNF
jgi:hypothetical protein